MSNLPVSLESGLVGLVVAVIGSVVSLAMSGQPLTWPVIVSAVIAAGLNYFTSSARSGSSGYSPSPSAPSSPAAPPSDGGQSW